MNRQEAAAELRGMCASGFRVKLTTSTSWNDGNRWCIGNRHYGLKVTLSEEQSCRLENLIDAILKEIEQDG